MHVEGKGTPWGRALTFPELPGARECKRPEPEGLSEFEMTNLMSFFTRVKKNPTVERTFLHFGENLAKRKSQDC